MLLVSQNCSVISSVLSMFGRPGCQNVCKTKAIIILQFNLDLIMRFLFQKQESSDSTYTILCKTCSLSRTLKHKVITTCKFWYICFGIDTNHNGHFFYFLRVNIPKRIAICRITCVSKIINMPQLISKAIK